MRNELCIAADSNQGKLPEQAKQPEYCVKHGDITDRTIVFTIFAQKGKELEQCRAFCLECLMEFLEEKIGIVEKSND